MKAFHIPNDVALDEYGDTFDKALKVAEYLLDADENDGDGCRYARASIYGFAALDDDDDYDWGSLALRLVGYDDLPFTSMMMLGLRTIWRAAFNILYDRGEL